MPWLSEILSKYIIVLFENFLHSNNNKNLTGLLSILLVLFAAKVQKYYIINISDKDFKNKSVENNKDISDIEITDAIEELENVNAYLYSMEVLMEKISDIKVAKNVEVEFKQISKKVAPDPLNIDRLIFSRLFHQTPDLPDNNNFK